MRGFRDLHIFSVTMLALVAAAGPAWGQTDVRPGFDLFTVDQDVSIGKQSAVEVERQMAMLSEPAISLHISDLGARLAALQSGLRRLSPAPAQGRLAGLSPVTGVQEQVTVLTSLLPDADVIHMLLVTKAQGFDALAVASNHMAGSLEVNLRATHN